MTFTEKFAAACADNGMDYASLAGRFDELNRLLTEFNAHTNLTAIRDDGDAIVRHYLDSLTAVPFIPEGTKKLVDVGCGGGFPALPIAIARPEIAVTALDSTAKKLVFVAQAAEKLGLNVTTLCARAEDADRDAAHREKYSIVTARAVANLSILCELCLPLTAVGGRFIAMKGPSGREELKEAKIAIAALGGEVGDIRELRLSAADGDMERVIILIEKGRETPEIYPRSYGKIIKKPL